jgi:hypothetical protein
VNISKLRASIKQSVNSQGTSTGVGVLAFDGRANQEQRACLAGHLPARPRTRAVAKTLRNAEQGHQRFIEGEGALEVGLPMKTCENMRQN